MKICRHPGSRECQSLSLVSDGRRDRSCVGCNQVDDLLCLVAKLKEGVERLKRIRESEKKIDWWNQALALLKQEPEGPAEKNKTQGVLNPPPARRKAVSQGKGVNGSKSTLGKNPHGPHRNPHGPLYPPRCLCTTGMRLWM